MRGSLPSDVLKLGPSSTICLQDISLHNAFMHQQHLLCLVSLIACSGEKMDIRSPPSVCTYIPLVGMTSRMPTSVSWPSPCTSLIPSFISPESHPTISLHR